MKRHLSFAFVLLVTLGATAFAGPEKNFEEAFSVGPNATFSLDSHKGNIKVRTGGDQILVKARVYYEEAVDARVLDYVNIEATHSGNLVKIEVEFDQKESKTLLESIFGKNSYSWPMVDFDIVVPDDSNLRIDSHKATFDFQVPSGDIEIESHKGSGTIANVRGDFALETHKGQFTVDVSQLGDIDIETHKGDVEILLGDASDFTIDGESHKGSLAFTGRDIRVHREDGESTVSYAEGTSRHRIRLETHKGNIRLNFDR